MADLNNLKKQILEDGVIDLPEVELIRTVIYADGVIDREEADFLFDLNDAVSDKVNATEWGDLFVKAITEFLLHDEDSPGEIDPEEAAWLYDKIGADGKVDDLEIRLLNELRDSAKAFPESLKALLG